MFSQLMLFSSFFLILYIHIRFNNMIIRNVSCSFLLHIKMKNIKGNIQPKEVSVVNTELSLKVKRVMLMIFSIDLSSIVNEVIRRNNFIFFYKRFHTQKKTRNANKAFIQMILYALESIKKQLPLISNIKSKTEQVFAHIYISNLSQMLLKSIKNKQATSSQTLIKRKMLSFLFYVFSFLDVLSIQKCSSFFFSSLDT